MPWGQRSEAETGRSSPGEGKARLSVALATFPVRPRTDTPVAMAARGFPWPDPRGAAPVAMVTGPSLRAALSGGGAGREFGTAVGDGPVPPGGQWEPLEVQRGKLSAPGFPERFTVLSGRAPGGAGPGLLELSRIRPGAGGRGSTSGSTWWGREEPTGEPGWGPLSPVP